MEKHKASTRWPYIRQPFSCRCSLPLLAELFIIPRLRLIGSGLFIAVEVCRYTGCAENGPILRLIVHIFETPETICKVFGRVLTTFVLLLFSAII